MVENSGLKLDDPTYLRIKSIVFSEQGVNAAVEAAKNGIPSLCGVDKLLREQLKELYTKEDLGTASAGDLVAQLMRAKGFHQGPTKKCGPGCTAKTGILWLAA